MSPSPLLLNSIRSSQALRIRGPSCFARLLRPDGWEVCRWTETDFATFQDETTFDAREGFMGSFVAGCGWPRVMPLRKTTCPCSWVTNPNLELFFFFFEGCSFSFFAENTSSVALPHLACGSLTLMIASFFERDQQKFDDRAVVHLCRMLVIASSTTMRVSCSASRKVAFSFRSAGTAAFPSATSPIQSAKSAVRTQNLRLVALPRPPFGH